MGDPKKNRKKYSRPSHPWEGERIKAEKELSKKYGLKNKTEIWKAKAELRRYRRHARELQAKLRYGDPQAVKESEELLEKLSRLGILYGDDVALDSILGLEVESILARRLQTIVYLKGMANSMQQARQFIVHGHISVNGRKVTVPGYLVKKSEEDAIDYFYKSPLKDELHPERTKKRQKAEGFGRESVNDNVAPDAIANKTPEVNANG